MKSKETGCSVSMKILLISALVLILVGCANTAVIKQATDSSICGKGVTRLIPSDGGIWLVLCEDGRVLWMDFEE